MSSHGPEQGERPLPGTRRTRRAAAAWALTVLALSATVQTAAGAERSDSVLVRMDPALTAADRADLSRALDADSVRPLVAGWRAYELPEDVTLAQARRLLAGEDAAASVELDARLFPAEIPDDTYFASQWALPRIGAPAAWDATGGAGEVVVAVIDTGVQTEHPDISARLWQNPGEVAGNGIDDDANGRIDDTVGWNFYDGTNVLYSPADGDSHGTHVAGTIAAQRANGAGVAGVADNARIMPLKFLKPGGGYTSDAIMAIQYAVAEGADIINASWGGETYSQPLCDAIRLAGDAGVLFVAAAGNGGADGIGDDNDVVGAWPANCPAASLVSVAATTQADGIAAFSNYGASSVDLGAPGEDVLSTVPSLSYGYKSGTSMATPHVSGAGALVLGMHPGLAPWQVKAALTGGGTPLPALTGRTVSGRRLDLPGALSAAGTGVGPDTEPPDPFSALSPADGTATGSPGAVLFTWAPTADAGSGVTAYRVVIDGAVAASLGPSARSASVAVGDGVHTWSVVAQDAAGNVRATPVRTLTVDRTPPTVPALRAPAGSGSVTGPVVELSWSPASDAVSGVASYRVIVDGVAATTVPGGARSARVAIVKGGHAWQVVAVDGLGNQATSAARNVTVVRPAPPRKARSPKRALRLAGPARVKSGRAPRLRLRSPRALRVVVKVKRAGRARPVASFRIRARKGVTRVRVPRRAAIRMRAKGTYVISARASSRLRDSVRIKVVPRRPV